MEERQEAEGAASETAHFIHELFVPYVKYHHGNVLSRRVQFDVSLKAAIAFPYVYRYFRVSSLQKFLTRSARTPFESTDWISFRGISFT